MRKRGRKEERGGEEDEEGAWPVEDKEMEENPRRRLGEVFGL